jgi:hypothetical protein
MCPNQVGSLNVAYYLTSSITLTEIFRFLLSPVEALFQTILENGLEKRFEGESNWKQWLQPQYHQFSGDYPGFNGRHGETFRFIESAYPISLKMAAPLANRMVCCWITLRICSLLYLLLSNTFCQPSFFTSEGYSKHLLGNAFSIPTVELLLRPLQRIFARKDYPDFSYEFAWNAKESERVELSADTVSTPSLSEAGAQEEVMLEPARNDSEAEPREEHDSSDYAVFDI